MSDQAKPPLSDEEKGLVPGALYPICPHCKADPIFPIGQAFNIGKLETVLVFCRACRTLLKIVELGIMEPQQSPPGNGPRIVRPQ